VVDAGVLYSDDHGDSWHARQVPNSFVDGELSPGEISVAELADGRLYAAGRNEIISGDHRVAAISADGGTTFPAFALTLSRAGGRRRDAVRAEPGRRGRRLHQHHVVQVLGHREQCQPGTGVEGGADAIGPVQGQAGLADAGTAGEDADADGRAGPVGQVGSDVSALTTSATPTDGGFLLNGMKSFVSNGSVADVVVTYASTDQTAGHLGITGFVVGVDAPGVAVGPALDKLGLAGCAASTGRRSRRAWSQAGF